MSTDQVSRELAKLRRALTDRFGDDATGSADLFKLAYSRLAKEASTFSRPPMWRTLRRQLVNFGNTAISRASFQPN